MKKVKDHPKVVGWPPRPGGAIQYAAGPRTESEEIIRVVHVESVTESIPLSIEFMGNLFTYDVQTTDGAFAKMLAAEFSKHIGDSLKQLGELDIDF